MFWDLGENLLCELDFRIFLRLPHGLFFHKLQIVKSVNVRQSLFYCVFLTIIVP